MAGARNAALIITLTKAIKRIEFKLGLFLFYKIKQAAF